MGDLSDRLAPLYKKRGPKDRDTPLAVCGFAGEMEGTPLAYPLDTPGYGLMDSARRVIGCHLNQRQWFRMRLTTGRAISIGLMGSARHIIGCHLVQDMRIRCACEDVASNIHQSLSLGRRWWR